MKTIVDYTNGLIKDFGKTTITGYSEKQANQIRHGLDKIVAGAAGVDNGDISKLITAGPDGVYKINQESTIADQDVMAAINYLFTTLPNSYKNTLNAKATAEGFRPDAMLLQMMVYNRDRTITADYDNTASKAFGYLGDDKGGSAALTEDNLAIRFAKGDLTETKTVLAPRAMAPSDRAEYTVSA